MNNQELNTALYEKMFAEQDTYRKWLLTQPPEEILNHTYEYTIREDILLSLEYHDLADAQAAALLKSFTPLADVFKGVMPFLIVDFIGLAILLAFPQITEWIPALLGYSIT